MWCKKATFRHLSLSLYYVVLSWITLKFEFLEQLWFFFHFLTWSFFFVLLCFDEFFELADGSSELLAVQYRKEQFGTYVCHFSILFLLKLIKNHLKFWKFYFSTFFREFSFAVCLRLNFELKSARNLNGITYALVQHSTITKWRLWSFPLKSQHMTTRVPWYTIWYFKSI